MTCQHTDIQPDRRWFTPERSVIVCQQCGQKWEYYYDQDEQRILKRSFNAVKMRRAEIMIENRVPTEPLERPKKVNRKDLKELGPNGYAEKYGYTLQQRSFLFNLYQRWFPILAGDNLVEEKSKDHGAAFQSAFEVVKSIMPPPGTRLTHDQAQGLTEMISGAIKVMYPLSDG